MIKLGKNGLRTSFLECHHNPSKPFRVDVDCSNDAIGAVLYQDEDKPIMFASRRLRSADLVEHFPVPKISLPRSPDILPFEMVSLDLVNMPVARPGYSYVLTVIDNATHWLQVVPLANIRASTVMNAFLKHWIYVFGPPARVHSDCGTQFTSTVFDELMRHFGIRKTHTTGYCLQGNSLVERVHRTLKDRLRLVSNGSWLDNFEAAVFDCNRIPICDDGPSAFENVFGRTAAIPATREHFRSLCEIPGPRIGIIAIKGESPGPLAIKGETPRFRGQFTVDDRPSSVLAKLNNGTIVNI